MDNNNDNNDVNVGSITSDGNNDVNVGSTTSDGNSNWHHLQIGLEPKLMVDPLIEQEAIRFSNIDALIEQDAINFTNSNELNNDKTLFGKAFFDDINNSIYGENVNLLTQPFIGYIRRHEKKYSYEIGEYSLLLKESKQLIVKTRKQIDDLLKEKSSLSSDVFDRLSVINININETIEWLFDIRKIYSKMDTYYGPSNNPIGSISQIRMLSSYQKLLEEVKALDYNQESALIRKNLDKIIKVLQNRLDNFGGIKSTMRRIDGSLDFDLPILDISEQEKVLILVEFIDALNQDWTKEKKKLQDDNEGLQVNYQQLHSENYKLTQENEMLIAKNAELESKLEMLAHQKLLSDAANIVPSELLDELRKVEGTIDASLTDLHNLHKVQKRNSSFLDFNDSVSTRDIIDETFSVSDASKLIVDDYTINTSFTKEAESRKMSPFHDRSVKEMGLAASFKGSNVPFVKINLVPKLGGPWRKKQIIDRRKKASLSNLQSPIQPNLVVEATKNLAPSEQDIKTDIFENNDEVVSTEPAHIKQIAQLTTTINKKLNNLKRSTKLLKNYQTRNSPQRSPIGDYFETTNLENFELDASVVPSLEDKFNGPGSGPIRRLSFQSAVSEDDNNSAFSASNVKLPNLAISYPKS